MCRAIEEDVIKVIISWAPTQAPLDAALEHKGAPSSSRAANGGLEEREGEGGGLDLC